MVTAVQIAEYLEGIKEAQSIYMDDLVLREKLGHLDIVKHRVVATVLDCYVKIMCDYLSQPEYVGGLFITEYNFYDEEEAKEVMERINRICDTEYFLDLT